MPSIDESGSALAAEARQQKTALLFRNAGVAQSVNVVNAGLLAYVNATQGTASRWAFAWCCLIILLAAVRYGIALRFRAASPGAVPAWRRWYTGCTALMGAAWGAGTVLFMWNAPDGARMFTGLVMSGMVAGSVPLLASVPAAFRAFAVLVTLPMSTVMFLQARSPLHWAFAIMSLVFLAAVMAGAHYLHETLDTSIRLGLEKARLAGTLEHALAEREKLESEQRLLMAAVEQSNASIVVTDAAARITFANRAFTRITGYELEEALGRNPRILKSGLTSAETYRDLWAALTAGKSWHDELCNRRKSGELIWEAASISPIIGADGRITHYLGVMDDITDRKRMEQELIRLAATDPLTGVANRRRFLEQMEMELARVKRFRVAAALLMLDLDHFKNVNDTFGHASGDEVLKHFAGLAIAQLRKTDLFGRLGGEEFGVLLPGTDGPGALQVAEGLRAQVAATPIQVGAGPIPCTVSIGLTVFLAEDDTPDSIFARADGALYRAKKEGRNRAILG